MTWNSKVVWSEGMFLQPQHLQQHDRYVERLIEARARPIAGWCWGFTSLALDEAALALGKLALASAQGVLPDGTPFDFPAARRRRRRRSTSPRDARDERVVLALALRRPACARSRHRRPRGGRAAPRYEAAEVDVGDSNARRACRPRRCRSAALRLRLMLAARRHRRLRHARRRARRRAPRRQPAACSTARYIAPMLHARARTPCSPATPRDAARPAAPARRALARAPVAARPRRRRRDRRLPAAADRQPLRAAVRASRRARRCCIPSALYAALPEARRRPRHLRPRGAAAARLSGLPARRPAGAASRP